MIEMDTSSNTDYKFDLDAPIPEAYAKIGYFDQGESLSDSVEAEEISKEKTSSFQIGQTNRCKSRRGGYSLPYLMHAFTNKAQHAFLVSALSLDLTRIPSRSSSTRFYEMPAIVRDLFEEKRGVLPPSRALMMQRGEVQKTCLFAPSGALLTWLEMLEEKISDDE
jgi:hypothetical protein